MDICFQIWKHGDLAAALCHWMPFQEGCHRFGHNTALLEQSKDKMS